MQWKDWILFSSLLLTVGELFSETTVFQELILSYLCASSLTLKWISSAVFIVTGSNAKVVHFIVAESKYILKNGGESCQF